MTTVTHPMKTVMHRLPTVDSRPENTDNGSIRTCGFSPAMRRFHPGYTLAFLIVLLAALLATRWFHQRLEGRYQERLNAVAAYTVDDWIRILRLEELLGEPVVTPIPLDALLAPTPTATPTPSAP